MAAVKYNGYNNYVTSPILNTKFFIPPQRPNIVVRPRLIEKLSQGLEGKLTLISATVGFGKTTLLSEFLIDRCSYPTAWLSLDEEDNAPIRFLIYFITALQKIESGIGERALMLLRSAHSPDIKEITIDLLNQIAEISHNFSVILDDYHLIKESEIQDALVFILDNQPLLMHLIIFSRANPPRPLTRLRVRGEITEITIQNIGFYLEEISIFLNEIMKLGLSKNDIAKLIYRTEGWTAGLHRKISDEQPPYWTPGVYHSFNKENAEPMEPGDVNELVFNLLPTSVLFRKGHRIRIAIAGADRETFALIDGCETPEIRIERNRVYPSYLELPIVPCGGEKLCVSRPVC